MFVAQRARHVKEEIKVPLSLLVDIGSLLYALVNVFHPNWLIRSNFRLRRSDNLHKDSHQNSWAYSGIKKKNNACRHVNVLLSGFETVIWRKSVSIGFLVSRELCCRALSSV